MTILLWVVAVVVIVTVLILIYLFPLTERPLYQYSRRKFLLTRSEHECYDLLVSTVGDKYFIFAQVHLPTILDHKVVGQSWRAAFSHISQKSVDFVLCDKEYISPVLAIELDDSSHERQDRIDRDHEVERILKEAGMPLLRLKSPCRLTPPALATEINAQLAATSLR